MWMDTPFKALRFLYVGSADFERDFAYYHDTLAAERVWHFEAFDANVAAFRLGDGPLLLLADHRPAPSCLPVYEVTDLKATARTLKQRGWKPEGRRFEIPNGPCYVFHDPSGNPFAIFEDVRPGAMEGAFNDPTNAHAVKE
jgi:predicted enzyme related to lactoylglutathione lyase